MNAMNKNITRATLAGVALVGMSACATGTPTADEAAQWRTDPSVSANDFHGVPALKECETKAGSYPVPCVWDPHQADGKGAHFWAVGSGKNYRFEVTTVKEANAQWRDPTQWTTIDTESAKLIQGYTGTNRDWSKCGYRYFLIDGSKDVLFVACTDKYLEVVD